MPNCRTCPHAPYSNESDICNECRNEPDAGWGGFTNGKYGRYFYTEVERAKYEREYADRDDRMEDDI